jgi:hypothetical protein
MTSPLEESFKEQKELHYYLSLVSLINGSSLSDLELEIEIAEELEEYAICSGVQEAIKDAKRSSYKNIKLIVEELNSKYNF